MDASIYLYNLLEGKCCHLYIACLASYAKFLWDFNRFKWVKIRIQIKNKIPKK